MFTPTRILSLILSMFLLCGYVPATARAVEGDFMNEKALSRISGGLKIPTVGSVFYEEVDFEPFRRFKAYLAESYPEVYRAMLVEYVNEYSIVLCWKGKNPALEPILFLSHYDVVPAGSVEPLSDEPIFQPYDSPYGPAEETQIAWDYPVFSGAVANGRVYGRGALDMKGMLFAIMEAADMLLAEGFQPEQDIWFAFGHDEETGGLQGAAKIAALFKSRGLEFDAVFDEGGLIGLEGAVLDELDRPIAVVGLGEKGYLTLGVTVRGIGGHSSMPVARSSLVQAAEIAMILNSNQLDARVTPPVAMFLETVKSIELPEDIRKRLAEAAQKPAESLDILSGNPVLNALVRTTTAVTMMRGSEASNVISPVSEVVVNFRILHGDTVESVTEHVRLLCSGYDVEINVIGSSREASSLTPPDSRGFRALSESIKSVYPDVLVLPYITVGGTDAYKYQTVSDNIYRFMPVRLNRHELGTIHNANEYISVENYENMIKYFHTLMRSYHSYK